MGWDFIGDGRNDTSGRRRVCPRGWSSCDSYFLCGTDQRFPIRQVIELLRGHRTPPEIEFISIIWHQIFVVVVAVQGSRDPELAHIVPAAAGKSDRFRFAQGRQEYSGQYGDDGDDHQKLDHGKMSQM